MPKQFESPCPRRVRIVTRRALVRPSPDLRLGHEGAVRLPEVEEAQSPGRVSFRLAPPGCSATLRVRTARRVEDGAGVFLGLGAGVGAEPVRGSRVPLLVRIGRAVLSRWSDPAHAQASPRKGRQERGQALRSRPEIRWGCVDGLRWRAGRPVSRSCGVQKARAGGGLAGPELPRPNPFPHRGQARSISRTSRPRLNTNIYALNKDSEGGASGRTRTCNLLIRSQKLYPIELRTHFLAGPATAGSVDSTRVEHKQGKRHEQGTSRPPQAAEQVIRTRDARRNSRTRLEPWVTPLSSVP